MEKIKSTILTFAVAAVATFGMVACDKGTQPGETNVERSDIKEEGSMIVPDDDGEKDPYSDTARTGEEYYDHADHENHGDNSEKTLGDGAYDGKGNGVERDEVQ